MRNSCPKKLAYCDLEQAESRTVGAILFRLFGDDTFLAVQESGDPHTLVCSMCWRNLDWPEDFTLKNLLASPSRTFPCDLLARAKKVAGQAAYREMSFRDLAKRLAHGSNYKGQPTQMARATHTERKLVESFQSNYFGAFPFILRWHEWVENTLAETRQITTMLGRRRHFFDRPSDPATIREAVAFEPQSVATGDYMNEGFRRLWMRNLPITINKHIHDALAFTFNEKDESRIIPEVCATLSWPILLAAHPTQLAALRTKRFRTRFEEETLSRLSGLVPRTFSIPVEAKTGWNLGFASAENPNGLAKFPPASSRSRVPPVPFAMQSLFSSPRSGL